VGIPREKIGSIFEKFTQADASTTRKFGGTGLGLTICRELVRLMQGEVQVESELGKGSCFSFTARLPETDEVLETEPEPKDSPAAVRGRLVLIVDDNELNRIVGRQYLRRLGCEVEVATGGQEAVERVKQGGIELVFMDCQMPEVDGYEATRRIRGLVGELGKTRIVAMTANAMQGDREKCLASGMDDYVSKPIREPELAATLRRADSQAAEKLVVEEAAGPASLLDRMVLAQLAGSTAEGHALVGKLVDLFRRDSGGQVSSIARAATAREWRVVARQAHSLKGITATLGAARLSEVAHRLERAALGRDATEADAAIAELAMESQEVVRLLQQWKSETEVKEPSAASLLQPSVA
jgi:CheY-like chemotaxis protein